MTIKGSGLLAIWSTVDAAFETDYLHWLTREHVFERVGVPGFRCGRVLRQRDSAPAQYMILYEQDDAQVMGSAGYQARLNAPTPWTQRVMPQLQKFRRGGGSIVRQSGHAHAFGSCVAVVRFEDGLPDLLHSEAEAGAEDEDEAESDKWAAVSRIDRVVNLYAMEVATSGTQISTREKSMRRGEEGEFAGILVVEALDSGALRHAIEMAAACLALPVQQFETYDLVFAYAGQ